MFLCVSDTYLFADNLSFLFVRADIVYTLFCELTFCKKSRVCNQLIVCLEIKDFSIVHDVKSTWVYKLVFADEISVCTATYEVLSCTGAMFGIVYDVVLIE